MSDLDKRLGKIIDDIANKSNSAGLKGLAFTWGIDFQELIKQAFKDAGYVRIETPDETTRREWEEADKVIRGSDYLSGQEWYDHFVKEVEKFSYDHRGGVEIYLSDELVDCAKKAAGLL